MKKVTLSLFAVALIAILSAFATKSASLSNKYHPLGQFTSAGSQFMQVEVVTGEIDDEYLCQEDLSNPVCTFISPEAAVVRDGKLSITLASYNSRTNEENGIYDPQP